MVMDSATSVSIIAAVLTLGITYWQRKRLIDITCTSVFFLSNVLFVQIGVLLSPWLINNEYIKSSYSFNFDIITKEDMVRSICIVTTGMMVVLIGHIYLDIIRVGTYGLCIKPRRWCEILRKPNELDCRVSLKRLKIIYLICLLISVAVLMRKSNFAVSGLVAFVTNDASAWYQARYQIGEFGRFYFILVFNGLPFLSITFWMNYKLSGKSSDKIWAVGSVLSTLIMSFLTFQKRPLIIYLICLIVSNYICNFCTNKSRYELPKNFPTIKCLLSHETCRIITPVLFLLCILILFYKMTMESASLQFISSVALNRILGRLSIMSLMYAHYFPYIEPHYGTSNIGILSSLFDTHLYKDTVIVPSYFDRMVVDIEGGSGAINAIFDFYGAFGWTGVFCGCFGIGIILNILDRWLIALPATSVNRSLYIFMILFSYYLSQASVPRSILTYGGATFVLLWVILTRRLRSDNIAMIA